MKGCKKVEEDAVVEFLNCLGVQMYKVVEVVGDPPDCCLLYIVRIMVILLTVAIRVVKEMIMIHQHVASP